MTTTTASTALVASQRNPSFKVILLGDEGAGKSTLFHRLRVDDFTVNLPKYRPSDFCKKDLQIDAKTVEVRLHSSTLNPKD